MEPYNIIYITDENYVMPTCVSITSLIYNNIRKQRYQVYVLTNHISEESKEKFKTFNDKYVKCRVVDVSNDKYTKLAETCLNREIYVTDTALYKFDIGDIFSDIEKVLYLDSDILINNDISELFKIDVSKVYLAAVDDMGDVRKEDGISKLAERIGITDALYFNSGVMLLNLKAIREECIGKKLLEYRMTQSNYFMDQDAFNGVMYKKRLNLPYRYNFRTSLFDYMTVDEISDNFFESQYLRIEDCISEQSILHMTDKWKPWKFNIPWISELFMFYYKMSPHKEEEIQLLSPLKVLNDKLNRLYADNTWLIGKYETLKKEYNIEKNDRRKVWKFPYNQVKKNSKVVIFGAGCVGTDLCRQIEESQYCELLLWVDKNWKLMANISVSNPEDIKKCLYDFIIIAILKDKAVSEVERYLYALGVDMNKVIKIKDT